MKTEPMDCPACDGTGAEATGTTYGDWDETVACSVCGGTGHVDAEDGDPDEELPDLDLSWVEAEA